MENNNDYNEKLYKFIKKCQRYHYKPDLHSFWIDRDGYGRVYVECGEDTIRVEYFNGIDDMSIKFDKAIDAAKYLTSLGVLYSTIDM